MKSEDLLFGLNRSSEFRKKNESPLKSLQIDLDFYSDSIKEVAVELETEGITSYPIFIAHQHELNMGELIIDRTEVGTQWSIHASTLEEFIEKKLVLEDKVEHFKKNYKDLHSFMCIFVVVPEGANFVFYPYK